MAAARQRLAVDGGLERLVSSVTEDHKVREIEEHCRPASLVLHDNHRVLSRRRAIGARRGPRQGPDASHRTVTFSLLIFYRYWRIETASGLLFAFLVECGPHSSVRSVRLQPDTPHHTPGRICRGVEATSNTKYKTGDQVLRRKTNSLLGRISEPLPSSSRDVNANPS